MSVSSVASSAASTASSTTTSSTSSGTTSSSSTLSSTFLTLLMTELENQDPLNPTDATQFTSQLMSLTSVEEQVNTNSLLTTMSTNLSSLLSLQEAK